MPSVLQLVQQQEEAVLTKAMQQHRESPAQADAWLADEGDDLGSSSGGGGGRPRQPAQQPYRTSISDVGDAPFRRRTPGPRPRQRDLVLEES